MPTKELRVMERIAKYGPCTLDELTSVGGFTRSSVYRSLTKLEDCGWVRRSLDGRRYFLTSRLEKLLDRASVPASHAESILDVIKQDLLSAKHKLTLIHHVRGEAFEIVDATGSQADALSMMFDVQDSIPPIIKAMAKFVGETGNEEDKGITLVRLPALLFGSADSDGFVIDDYSQTAMIAIHSKADGLFLLLCATKSSIRLDREGLADYCRGVCRSLVALADAGPFELLATELHTGSRRRIIRLRLQTH
jgi:DNA-binding MarR family transcriptional regulator